MAEIVLDRVTKSYASGAAAVNDLSLTIADGEFIILVGPSGCGKSTTLNMIAGLEDISSGELRIGGERVNEKAPKDRDIAMVFQSYALYPHMTVRQNIAFPLTLAKMKKDEIASKVEDAAKTLDLTELLDRKPAQLSGGQRQRVAMGRAIVRNPKAFLMDEPLSNLDAKLRVQMRSEIARLQDRLGTTTVYVTHDQTEAMTLGDRVVVLLAGVAQQIGTPDELYRNPANLFVAGFIGSPSMNFFPATMTDVGLRLPFGDVTLTQEVHDLLARHSTPNNVIVGIRPEHLEDAALLDGYARIRALTFDVKVELVESLGADKYVHFTTEGAAAQAAQLAELAADSGVGENEFVARVSTESQARQGETLQLAFDTSKMTIFDADSGKNLTLPDSVAGDAPAPDELLEPSTEPPAPDEPTSDAPASDEPTSESAQPSTERPAPDEPTNDAPAPDEPTSESAQPSTERPAPDEPSAAPSEPQPSSESAQSSSEPTSDAPAPDEPSSELSEPSSEPSARPPHE